MTNSDVIHIVINFKGKIYRSTIFLRDPEQQAGNIIIPNCTLILSAMAVKITAVLSDLITVSHESCLAYLRPTQVLYEEKVFLCKRH